MRISGWSSDVCSADLDGVALAVAATDQAALNAAVSAQAQARGIPVNVVDSPSLCSAVFPAIVDRSPLVVAVGSGGHAPVLARLVRAKLETWRSEARRVGQECVRTCRSRWWPE